MDATASTFTLQTSQAFFNQFFCRDYPQFQAQSTSTTRHMDITRVHQHIAHPHYPQQPHPHHQHQHSRHHPGMPPPPHHHYHHHSSHGPPQGHPSDRHGGYPPMPPHMHPPHGSPGNYPPNDGRMYKPMPHGHGQPPYPPPHGHGGHPPPSSNDPNHRSPHMNPSRPPYPGHPLHPSHHNGSGHPPPHNNQQQQPRGGHLNDAQHPSSTSGVSGNEEFVNKVKEIERRIIQHLHQRGYDEKHPDYHRYLQKAKELAIQKAGKERDKMLQQQQRDRGIPNNIPPQDLEAFMRYRHEKQRQNHAMLKAQQMKAQQRGSSNSPRANAPNSPNANANANANGNGNGSKLTLPTKSSSSVKGLIVLRGLPGSGKTTLARKLAQRSKNARICTEDRYHWSGNEDGVGEYKFQPQLVFLAREWCTKEIRDCIDQNVNLIILDNHNARISMYEDHIHYAVDRGYRFRIIEFVATTTLIDKYRERSYKKFPREVYVKLLKLWERDPRSELINPTFGDLVQQRESGKGRTVVVDEQKDNGHSSSKGMGVGGKGNESQKEEAQTQQERVVGGADGKQLKQ